MSEEMPGTEETSTPACGDQQKDTCTHLPPGAQPMKIAPDAKDMNRIVTAESFDSFYIPSRNRGRRFVLPLSPASVCWSTAAEKACLFT